MIRVHYWNTRKRTENYRPLLNSDYDILAIQEPVPPGGTPLCPRSCNFWLVYGGGRAAIYINKRHPLSTWTAGPDEDICSVTVEGTAVYSIYSLTPQRGTRWDSSIHGLLTRTQPNVPVALVNDFNLHHPLWDAYERQDQEADDLLLLAEAWDL